MMKSILLILALGFVFSFLVVAVADHHGGESKKLRHVVAFKFKADAPEAGVKKVVDAFRALPKTIKEIKAFEWGTNVSPEKHDKGFTHMFTLTFDSAADRDAYLVHPDHKAFGQTLGPVFEDVFVIDYWTQD